MLLEAPRRPLRLVEVLDPAPGPGQILIAVKACGVCRTDLHAANGDLPDPKLPLVLAHQIVGTVAALGTAASESQGGHPVAVHGPGWACRRAGTCPGSRAVLSSR